LIACGANYKRGPHSKVLLGFDRVASVAAMQDQARNVAAKMSQQDIGSVFLRKNAPSRSI
jgi:hypothetical protein